MTPHSFQIPQHPIAVGGRVPDFQLPDRSGGIFRLYDSAVGQSVALVLLPDTVSDSEQGALRALAAALSDTAARDTAVVIVTPEARAGDLVPGPAWVCVDSRRQVLNAYRGGAGLAPAALAVFLLDANRRVSALHQGPDFLTALLADLKESELQEDCTGPSAPILLLPRLFDDELCHHLMTYWEQGNVFEGTVGSVDPDGEYNRVYHDRKRRLDCKVEQPELHRQLEAAVGQRIAPELEKAFQFAGFHFERFLIVCYDAARRDFFQPHRDNLSPGTVDRRFAVTVNLNEGYDGGELVFPEFGNTRYSTARGGAIVFSCSLIHEVLPVTRGKRYSLLNMCREHRPAQDR